MAFSILYTVQKAAAKNPRVVGIRVLNVCKEYQKMVIKDYTDLLQYWAHEVPLKSRVNYMGGNVTVYVKPQDKVYEYITNGTSVRYATMKKGFQRKTTPNTLWRSPGSGPSADWVSFVSKSFPHPGIEARNFETLIMENHQKWFVKEIRSAVFQGVREVVRMRMGK